MKLYDSKIAPNPRRVRIFLAEKGLVVPTEEVDIGSNQHKSEEFMRKNPLAALPVLELDDGSYLAESIAICRYFESLHPTPSLMGTDPLSQARIEMWQRRMEFGVLALTAQTFRNTSSFFKGRIAQVPEYGEVCRAASVKAFEWLDSVLAHQQFIAGNDYSVADITALVGVDFGRPSKIRIMPEQKNLARWYAEVTSRPSAQA